MNKHQQEKAGEGRERLAEKLYRQKCDWEALEPAHWSRVIPAVKETYFRFADEILDMLAPASRDSEARGDSGQAEAEDWPEKVYGIYHDSFRRYGRPGLAFDRPENLGDSYELAVYTLDRSQLTDSGEAGGA